jgi:2-phosphoglycerate kinase
MTRARAAAPVVVTDGQPGLPYSKGLTASLLMATGLSPYRSYQVAERVEERLLDRGKPEVSAEALNTLTVRVLEEVAGDRYAKNFVRWQEVGTLDVPIVILIGGATGVGKSTIATQLAARLGIVRLVATDAIREVMRSMFSEDLMPTLYTSSFDADSALREPPPKPADPVIVGFREQTMAVAVGVHALMERAATEGTSLIVEGAHLVPGFVDTASLGTRVLAVEVIVTVEDEDMHRGHFAARAADSASRPFDRYINGFRNIRKVQKYIKSQALTHGVAVVPSYNLDQTLAAIVDLVVERATERLAERKTTKPRRAPRRRRQPEPVGGGTR